MLKSLFKYQHDLLAEMLSEAPKRHLDRQLISCFEESHAKDFWTLFSDGNEWSLGAGWGKHSGFIVYVYRLNLIFTKQVTIN